MVASVWPQLAMVIKFSLDGGTAKFVRDDIENEDLKLYYLFFNVSDISLTSLNPEKWSTISGKKKLMIPARPAIEMESNSWILWNLQAWN